MKRQVSSSTSSSDECGASRLASPRKSPGQRSGTYGKRMLRTRVKKPGPSHRPRNADAEDVADSDSDSELEKSLDTHVNDLLHEKAASKKLTVKNVKTILRHVITNESVLKMVRETLRDEGEWDSSQEDDDCIGQFYSPKMTRAKLRELMRRRQPDLVHPPSKPNLDDGDESLALLLREFKEEESSSDEEYIPKDYAESDDESRTSRSEFGSPATTGTPCTPKSANLRSEILTRQHVRSQSKKTPGSGACTTPSGLAAPETSLEAASNARKSLVFSQPMQENSDLISQRTRSRHPMKDTTLESFELSFIPPDITADMYEAEIENPDWAEFLRDFILLPPQKFQSDVNDDNEADPEYNILDEEECVDPDETLNNNRVRVSKKELGELMAELFEDEHLLNYQSTYLPTDLDTTCEDRSDSPCNERGSSPDEGPAVAGADGSSSSSSSSSDPECSDEAEDVEREPAVLSLSVEDRARIFEQMARHVQLLTQAYLLAERAPCLATVREEAREMMLELHGNAFPEPEQADENEQRSSSPDSGVSSPRPPVLACPRPSFSLFAVPNLPHAFEEVRRSDSMAAALKESQPLRDAFSCPPRCATLKLRVPYQIVERMLYSKAFLFPAMLPSRASECVIASSVSVGVCKCKMSGSVQKEKPIKFLPSEDKLLAMGLQEFSTQLKKKKIVIPHNSLFKDTRPLQKYPMDAVKLVQQYLMPARTVDQLRVRVKNMVSSRRKAESNALTTYLVTGRLRTDPVEIVWLDPGAEVTPLALQPVENFPPLWHGKVTAVKAKLEKGCGQMGGGRRKRPADEYAKPRFVDQNCARRPRELIPRFDFTKGPPVAPEPPHEFVIGMMHSVDDVKPVPVPPPLPAADAAAPAGQAGPRLGVSLEEVVLQTVATPSSRKYLLDNGDSPEVGGLPSPPKPASSSEPGKKGAQKVGPGAKRAPRSKPKPKPVASSGEADRPGDPLEDLMKASTTIKKPPRKTRKMKDAEAALKLLAEEDPEAREQREAQYVSEYLLRLHAALTRDGRDSVYDEFYELMADFDDGAPLEERVRLFDRVQRLLDGYPDLAGEFVVFLGDDAAFALNRYEEFSYVMNAREFLRCVELHFAGQPVHVQRIAKAMTGIATGREDDITKDNVKAAVLPLLKGNSQLVDLFTSLLRCEQPPDSLFNDSDYEEVNLLGEESGSSNDESPEKEKEIEKDSPQPSPMAPAPSAPPEDKKPAPRPRSGSRKRPSDEPAAVSDEEVHMVGEEDDDVYGGPDCICQCHEKNDAKLRARLRHCVTCGLKFVDGGIHVKVGKTLRPARVSYIYRPPETQGSVAQSPPVDAVTASDAHVADLDSPSPKKSGCKKPKALKVSPVQKSAKKPTSASKDGSASKKGAVASKAGGGAATGTSPSSTTTTPPDAASRKTPRRSSLTPGKGSPPNARKRKNPGSDAVSPAVSSASASFVASAATVTSASSSAPKVRKVLDLPAADKSVVAGVAPSSSSVASGTLCAPKGREFSTPAKQDLLVSVVPQPPSSSQQPDFSSLQLGMTPWKDDGNQPSSNGQTKSDVLETPRVDNR